MAFQYINRGLSDGAERRFTSACNDRTRCNSSKLKEGKFRLGISMDSFDLCQALPLQSVFPYVLLKSKSTIIVSPYISFITDLKLLCKSGQYHYSCH